MRELRLALASDTFLPQVNGVTRTLAGLCHELSRRGAQVRVFTTSDPAADADMQITRFPSIPFWAYPQLRIAVPGQRLMQELRKWRPTLVHAATPFGVGLAARAAAKAMGIPFVTSYHTSLSAYSRFYQLGALAEPCWNFLRWFHNSGSITFVPSPPIADELRVRGFHSLRIWGRGVDCRRFSPQHRSADLRQALAIPRDAVVALYVGRMAREKGLADLLHAMPYVARRTPEVRFVFVGDGPYEQELKARAPNEALFLGRRDGHELAALYASSDVFVFPSVTDTFGNVLLEAMASGLPVIAADAAPTRSLLAHTAPRFFPPGDCIALSEQIAGFARSRAERERAGALGLREALRRSWDVVFDDLFGAYRSVSHVQSSPPAAEARPAA